MSQKQITNQMLGRAIRVKRVIHDLNQVDLCNRLGLNLSTLSFYEQGHRMIPAETFDAICGLFGMTAKQMTDFAVKVEQEKTRAA